MMEMGPKSMVLEITFERQGILDDRCTSSEKANLLG
jgi:hypothetical protein